MNQPIVAPTLRSLLDDGYETNLCIGYAPSRVRRCHNPIAGRGDYVQSRLAPLSHRSRAERLELLKGIARDMLCKGNHSGAQYRPIADWWYQEYERDFQVDAQMLAPHPSSISFSARASSSRQATGQTLVPGTIAAYVESVTSTSRARSRYLTASAIGVPYEGNSINSGSNVTISNSTTSETLVSALQTSTSATSISRFPVRGPQSSVRFEESVHSPRIPDAAPSRISRPALTEPSERPRPVPLTSTTTEAPLVLPPSEDTDEGPSLRPSSDGRVRGIASRPTVSDFIFPTKYRRSIYHYLFKPLSSTEEEGYIYAFSRTSSPGYLKIGRAMSVVNRREAWRGQCNYNPIIHNSATKPVPFYRRAESLVHAILRLQNRIEYPCNGAQGCHKKHGEWFQVDLNTASRVISAVSSAMSDGLYDASTQELSEEWKLYDDENPLPDNPTIEESLQWINGFAQATAVDSVFSLETAPPSPAIQAADSTPVVSAISPGLSIRTQIAPPEVTVDDTTLVDLEASLSPPLNASNTSGSEIGEAADVPPGVTDAIVGSRTDILITEPAVLNTRTENDAAVTVPVALQTENAVRTATTNSSSSSTAAALAIHTQQPMVPSTAVATALTTVSGDIPANDRIAQLEAEVRRLANMMEMALRQMSAMALSLPMLQ
ncbi:MAG: hypothetical protein M1814_001037 [Vezdaea aestivalis]|nr:MAG: hypothetical protein M1814_001037 [Vezdaea aestivalis]